MIEIDDEDNSEYHVKTRPKPNIPNLRQNKKQLKRNYNLRIKLVC